MCRAQCFVFLLVSQNDLTFIMTSCCKSLYRFNMYQNISFLTRVLLYRLYFTRIQLGSPPQEFYVQIDTGSDVLWVGCRPCDGCPKSSGLQVSPLFIMYSFSVLQNGLTNFCSVFIYIYRFFLRLSLKPLILHLHRQRL